MRTNPNLTRVFNTHLFPRFGQYKVNGLHLDPWWWPRGPGRSTDDWGIPASATIEHASLLSGTPSTAGPGSRQYCGFLGSVRAQPGCPILVSIRPSAGSMQASFSTPGTKLPLIPEARCKFGSRLYPLHITDLYKFRQRCWSDDPFANTDATGWQQSIECLADELGYLGAVAAQVIVVKRHVKRCFAPGGPLWKAGQRRTAWRNSQQHCRLDRVLDIIETALALPDHAVVFWTTSGFKDEITRALSATPPHNPNLYLPDLL
jgi:hypothetical protein